jgi:hypothetical protein
LQEYVPGGRAATFSGSMMARSWTGRSQESARKIDICGDTRYNKLQRFCRNAIHAAAYMMREPFDFVNIA